jgi:hypothetical protein
MIPALVIWLCKKYILPRLNKKNSSSAVPRLSKHAVLVVVFLVLNFTAFASKLTQVYHIKRNGEIIGKLFFSQNIEGENTYLKITSQVSTRFVFKIDVQTEDLAHFKNGRLISSDVSRLVNGKAKERKKTIFQNDVYQLQAGNKFNSLNQPIGYNMMLLYTTEPVSINQVYSDNFQCFLPVKKQATHQYRVNLPDGNYNDYYFENGVCKLVVVNHSLYTIKMELV